MAGPVAPTRGGDATRGYVAESGLMEDERLTSEIANVLTAVRAQERVRRA